MTDPYSFRDHSGHVIIKGERIYRIITSAGLADFQKFYSHPLWNILQDKGKIQRSRLLTSSECNKLALEGDVAAIIEHEVLPLISYPYEWPFEALRTAALYHLQLHLELLEHGFTLKDASAYNIQFDGASPLFIDILSIKPYQDGEYWLAHNQFIQHFLAPLLLNAYSAMPFQLWLRSSLEGINLAALTKLLPLRTRLNYRLWLHLFLPVGFSLNSVPRANKIIRPSRNLPKKVMTMMLKQLAHIIARLPSPKRGYTAWENYSHSNSYDEKTKEDKIRVVRNLVTEISPSTLIDIGCNEGHYSRIALNSGARRVIGLDIDGTSLDRAFLLANKQRQKFTLLIQDLANPSPSQGWLNKERFSIFSRLKADCVMALAVIHHLAIGRNLPLIDIAQMLLTLAPHCLVEFVSKEDPMVKLMLSQREDIFREYNLDQFSKAIHLAGGTILFSHQLTQSTRVLLHIKRKQP